MKMQPELNASATLHKYISRQDAFEITECSWSVSACYIFLAQSQYVEFSVDKLMKLQIDPNASVTLYKHSSRYHRIRTASHSIEYS